MPVELAGHFTIVGESLAGLLRSASVGLLVLAVAGCGAQAADPEPAGNSPVPHPSIDPRINPDGLGDGVPVSPGTVTIRGIAPRLDGVGVDPSTRSVFVQTNWGIRVIDTDSLAVVATIDVPGTMLAVNPKVGEVYVTSADEVAVIDTSTRTVVDRIDGVSRAMGTALDPESGTLYVVDHSGASVFVIDTSGRQVVDTITVAGNQVDSAVWPASIAVDPVRGSVYVTSPSQGTMYVIDSSTREVADTIEVPSPRAVAVDPRDGAVYVGSGAEGAMSVIDTATHQVVDTIPVGATDWFGGGIAVDPTAPVVYVINRGGIAVIDTRTREVVDTLLGGGGAFLAVDASTGVVYETNSDWGSVSVFPARG